jgi:hypothetical protein
MAVQRSAVNVIPRVTRDAALHPSSDRRKAETSRRFSADAARDLASDWISSDPAQLSQNYPT